MSAGESRSSSYHWAPWLVLLIGGVAYLLRAESQHNRLVAELHEQSEQLGDLHEHFHSHDSSDAPHVHSPAGSRPHLHGQFTSNTHVEGRPVMAAEWSDSRYLAVPLPSSRNEDAAYLKLLADIAEVCLKGTQIDLLVVAEQNNVRGRMLIDRELRRRNLPAARVQLLEVAALDSIWLRDYGPMYTHENEKWSVIDAGYRDFRLATEDGAMLTTAFGIAPTHRPADDMIPHAFSTYLALRFVHPGFSANGGDFYTDGRGTLYTSEETLLLNSADRTDLEAIWDRYLGVKQTIYLRPLPGPTVKHVDMFFKLVDARSCLLGEYAEPDGHDERACLQRQARSTLDVNGARLQAASLRVTRVPMPDIEQVSTWDLYGRMFDEKRQDSIVADLAAGAGADVDAMTERLKGQHSFVYRTFTNCIELVDEGRRTIIMPTYAATKADQEIALSAYRSAYGTDVKLRTVDAECLALANGSLRCMTLPVPRTDVAASTRATSAPP